MTNPQPLTDLSDCRILFHGAGRAPGPALATFLAKCGATLAACDLSPVLLEPLREVHGIHTFTGDHSRGMPGRSLFDEAVTLLERLDVLILNPRVMPHTPILDMDEWDWQRTIEVNLHGTFLQIQLAARQMIEQAQGGTIIVLIDLNPPESGAAAYAAAQAAMDALVRAAAQELLTYNIGVVRVDLPQGGALTMDALKQIAHVCQTPAR